MGLLQAVEIRGRPGWLGFRIKPVDTVMLALEAGRGLAPQLLDDLERLGELLDADFGGRIGNTRRVVLFAEPTRA